MMYSSLNIVNYFFLFRVSRESYGDKAIGYVQLNRKNDICTVKGRVCPDHRVRSKAYAVTLTINEKLIIKYLHQNDLHNNKNLTLFWDYVGRRTA